MSTMYNQSANGYSAGGGGGGPGYTENPQHNEESEQNEEDEFGRTEEGKEHAPCEKTKIPKRFFFVLQNFMKICSEN